MISTARNAHRPPARIGLIGCGNIWRSVYHPILASLRDRVRITAFCDFSPHAAEAAAVQLPDARRYADPETLFREESLDGAMVLTSENANASTALAAFRAGLAVYLEKPPAVTSSEWQQLADAAEVEATSTGGQIYTAFNRRHTPLFRNWSLPRGTQLRTVRGALHRHGRPVATFPYTAVHLIDSVQFFTGQLLTETRAIFSEGEPAPSWNIQGRLEGGAVCDLTFVPDGPDHLEYLIFESDDRTWKLHFPNSPNTEHPLGLFLSQSLSREPGQDELLDFARGDKGADPLEVLGHAPCFRDFLARLEKNDWASSPHHLRRCEATVAILEEMLSSTSIRSPVHAGG